MNNLHQIKICTPDNVHLFEKIAIIGVDISKDTFHYSIPTKKDYFVSNVSMDIKGFNHFLKDTRKYHAANSFIVCAEISGGYESKLCQFLYDNQIIVYLISGRSYNNFRKEHGINAKSDEKDPIIIANICINHINLVKNANTTKMKFNKMLFFKPVPKNINKLKGIFFAYNKAKELNSLYNRWKDDMPERYEILQESHKAVKENEKETLKILVAFLKTFPEYDYMITIPSVGNSLIANMLILTHGFTRIENSKQIAAMFGLAPFDYSSGTSVNPSRKLSTPHGDICYKKARFVAVFSTLSAMTHNPIIKAHKNKLVAANNNKFDRAIQFALARKLVVMTWICGKNKLFFSELNDYNPHKKTIPEKINTKPVMVNRAQIQDNNVSYHYFNNPTYDVSTIKITEVIKFIVFITRDEVPHYVEKIEAFFNDTFLANHSLIYEAKLSKEPLKNNYYPQDKFEHALVFYMAFKQDEKAIIQTVTEIRLQMYIPHKMWIKEDYNENCEPKDIKSKYFVPAGDVLIQNLLFS